MKRIVFLQNEETNAIGCNYISFPLILRISPVSLTETKKNMIKLVSSFINASDFEGIYDTNSVIFW